MENWNNLGGGDDLRKKHSFKSVPTNLFLCVVELLSTGKIKFLELTQKREFLLGCVNCHRGISY